MSERLFERLYAAIDNVDVEACADIIRMLERYGTTSNACPRHPRYALGRSGGCTICMSNVRNAAAVFDGKGRLPNPGSMAVACLKVIDLGKLPVTERSEQVKQMAAALQQRGDL